MRIAVFLHGTTIMHRGGSGHPREVRVQQVQQREESVRDFASYVPIGSAVEKLHRWIEQGVEIIYLSSHKRPEYVEQDRSILKTYQFPDGPIIFRGPEETYQGMIERVMPDVVIEDDCESIGGEQEMVYSRLRPEIRARICSIVVREFEGIDHLPDDLIDLPN
jgi:hypothetical protein